MGGGNGVTLVITTCTVAKVLAGWGRRASQVGGGRGSAELWGITDRELKEIRRSLAELG